ncbi:MAG: phosphatidate cytidylyltransferase, partial [Bacteroidota bacterium]
MKGLGRRVITAVVFVVIMLAGLFTGPYTFSFLFLAITAACLWEFYSLTLDLRTKRDAFRK